MIGKPVKRFDRDLIRTQFGFTKKDFIVCSFGFLGITKLNHKLLNSWLKSTLSQDKNCYLIFVGEHHGSDYGLALIETIRSSGQNDRIRITGFTSPEVFDQYLMVADLAVQLRAMSRGETSAAVLKCMSYGLPVIINAHGPLAELDQDTVHMLTDEFDDGDLVSALEQFWRFPENCHRLGQKALKYVHEFHSPEICAKLYAEAIESFHIKAEKGLSSVIQTLSQENDFNPSDSELVQLSIALSRNHPLPKLSKRLYLDITATSTYDLKTGIERVARALTLALLESPPNGYRVEPVYLSCENETWMYRHARQYTLELINCPVCGLQDEVVEPEIGDVVLQLDLSGDATIRAEKAGLFRDYRNRGVAIYATVFDLLPVLLPHVFPPGTDQAHRQWLHIISKFDGAVCISKSVAQDLLLWQDKEVFGWDQSRSYSIGWFHLGSDISNSAPSRGLPVEGKDVLKKLNAHVTFLMVGTVEPRKAYMQVIKTFDYLWHDGVDVNLVIVGQEGWKKSS